MCIIKACSFTGHREIKDPVDTERLGNLVQSLIDGGTDTFLTGMAMGFDLIAAEVVISLKKKNPHIKLIGCVPCPDQDRAYPAAEKEKYKRVLKNCDEVKILYPHYHNGVMFARDRYMVDNSAAVIAYDRTHSGGTYYTLKYAQEKQRKIFLI